MGGGGDTKVAVCIIIRYIIDRFSCQSGESSRGSQYLTCGRYLRIIFKGQ